MEQLSGSDSFMLYSERGNVYNHAACIRKSWDELITALEAQAKPAAPISTKARPKRRAAATARGR